MKMFCLSFIYFFVLGVFCYSQTDSLTLEDCINKAILNNPQMKVAQGNLELGSSSYISARSGLLPQISFQGGLTRYGGARLLASSVSTAYYDNYTYGFQAQQLIFDFGKSISKVSAYSNLEDAAIQDYITFKQDLIISVAAAFYNYQQSIKIKDVNIEILRQMEDHLVEAEGFYNAGTRPLFDVLKARTDVANAKLNLITAENDIRINKIQLENVLSYKLKDGFVLKDNLDTLKKEYDLASVMETAFKNRPELISSADKIEANKNFLISAWTSNLPAISAFGNYNWGSLALDQKLLPGWNIGLTLSLPIFQGFYQDAAIQQAQSDLKIAEGQNDILVQSVQLEVEQDYDNYFEAYERIEASKDLVTQAEETFKLALGRYNQGVGSSIDVTDAQVTLLNAKTSYIEALYDYNLYYIYLQKAIGTLKY
jgi:outer membrane protein TolC